MIMKNTERTSCRFYSLILESAPNEDIKRKRHSGITRCAWRRVFSQRNDGRVILKPA